MRPRPHPSIPIRRDPIRRLLASAGLALLCLLSGCTTTPFPLVDLEPDVRGRIHNPEGAGPFPAVLLLHGSGGMRGDYHREAEFLAQHGYAVLVLDYYREVGLGGLTGAERQRRWRVWQDEIVRSFDFLRTRPAVDGDRIAVMGYSQGAALAISTAHRLPHARAIVDFFGPNVEGWYVGGVFGIRGLLPDDYLERMPPVLILQGSADPIVPKSNSQRLFDALQERGRVVEMHLYDGSLHSFHSPVTGTPAGRQVAQDARARVLRFLDEHTKAPAR